MNQSYRFLKGFFLLFFCLFFLKNAQAIEYNNIGGRPAFPRTDNPRTESIFIHEVKGGQVIDEGVYVINNSSEEKTFEVYAADSTKSTDGGYACKQKSEDSTGVGGWIQLERNEITLGSARKELIPFTINIPEKVDVGEYNGCILIQEKKAPSTKPGVNISFRTGLRVMLTVPGRIVKKVRTESFQIIKTAKGDYQIIMIAANDGNVSADVNLQIFIKTLIGTIVTKYGGQYAVLRNDIMRWNFDLRSPFWGGWYMGDASLTFAQDGGPTVLTLPPVWFFVIPHPLAIGIYVLLFAAIVISIIVFIKRRKEAQTLAQSLRPYVVLKDEDIQSIAHKFGISWKKLVNINHIKPPYSVKEGTLIKVPDRSKKA